VGTVAYFSLAKKETPQVVHAPKSTPTVVSTASEPTPPALLADVIEMTDLNPLLDPPVKPVSGVPFETEMVVPAVLTPAPDRIPPAVDD
jgi:hypothetical protein